MFLTRDQLIELTHRKRRKSQVTALSAMGIAHKVRPDGTIAVLQSHIDKSMGGNEKSPNAQNWEPDWKSLNAPSPQA